MDSNESKSRRSRSRSRGGSGDSRRKHRSRPNNNRSWSYEYNKWIQIQDEMDDEIRSLRKYNSHLKRKLQRYESVRIFFNQCTQTEETQVEAKSLVTRSTSPIQCQKVEISTQTDPPAVKEFRKSKEIGSRSQAENEGKPKIESIKVKIDNLDKVYAQVGKNSFQSQQSTNRDASRASGNQVKNSNFVHSDANSERSYGFPRERSEPEATSERRKFESQPQSTTTKNSINDQKVKKEEAAAFEEYNNMNFIKKERLSCSKCPQTFFKQYWLNFHVKKRLGPARYMLKCKACRKGFKCFTQYKIHKLSHEKKRKKSSTTGGKQKQTQQKQE